MKELLHKYGTECGVLILQACLTNAKMGTLTEAQEAEFDEICTLVRRACKEAAYKKPVYAKMSMQELGETVVG